MRDTTCVTESGPAAASTPPPRRVRLARLMRESAVPATTRTPALPAHEGAAAS